MRTREILFVAMTGALILAVLLLVAGAPGWGFSTVFVLAGITGLGALAAPRRAAGRERG